MTLRTAMALLAVAALACGSRAQTAFDASAARKSVEALRPAMVTVEAVAKISSTDGGDDSKREINVEVNGTVIDGSGLTVLSLPDLDPSSLLIQLMGAPAGGVQSEVSNVRLLMDDGTEVPAKIVLRDKEQNLAFVRPVTKPTSPMAFANLANETSADLLDEVVVVSRMGKVGNRAIRARADRVLSVIPKPRRRYVLNTVSVGSELGGTALSPDGKVLGVLTIRATRSDGSVTQAVVGGSLAQVVVPAADVLEVAAQAPENAVPDAKPSPAPSVKPVVPAQKTAPAKKAPAGKKTPVAKPK